MTHGAAGGTLLFVAPPRDAAIMQQTSLVCPSIWNVNDHVAFFGPFLLPSSLQFPSPSSHVPTVGCDGRVLYFPCFPFVVIL
jgi:hypothetical protein